MSLILPVELFVQVSRRLAATEDGGIDFCPMDTGRKSSIVLHGSKLLSSHVTPDNELSYFMLFVEICAAYLFKNNQSCFLYLYPTKACVETADRTY